MKLPRDELDVIHEGKSPELLSSCAACPADYLHYHDQHLLRSARLLVQGQGQGQRRASSWRRRLTDLDLLSLENCLDAGPLSRCEYALTAATVFLGATATLAATFFSIRDTLRYATFTPPCLVNVTQASKILAIITDGVV